MRVLHRFIQLAKADAHGVLDSLEDRALLVKQHLRDAELELERKRRRVAELREGVERRERRRRALAEEEAALDADIALALEREEESLARFSIRRWLAKRRQAGVLATELGELGAELARLETLLAAQEDEFRALSAQAEAELHDLRAAADLKRAGFQANRACSASGGDAGVRGASVLEEEVELEWLRRTGLHGAGDAVRAAEEESR